MRIFYNCVFCQTDSFLLNDTMTETGSKCFKKVVSQKSIAEISLHFPKFWILKFRCSSLSPGLSLLEF